MEWQPPIDVAALATDSQGAEEAMLDRVFELIAPRHRFCVEFGAGDGLRNSNIARLLRDGGSSGVMIEASDYRFAKLREHHASASNVRIVQARVQPVTGHPYRYGPGEEL